MLLNYLGIKEVSLFVRDGNHEDYILIMEMWRIGLSIDIPLVDSG